MGGDGCGGDVRRARDRDVHAVEGYDFVWHRLFVIYRDPVVVGDAVVLGDIVVVQPLDGIADIELRQLVELRHHVVRHHEPIVMSTLAPTTSEALERFDCFGGTCSVLVQGPGPAGDPLVAAERVMRRLLAWHAQFSRFDPASELSALNRDPRDCVPVSPMMARFVDAAVRAAAITGGLVDPTLVTEVEQAGYHDHFAQEPLPAADALRLAPPRRAAAPHAAARWRHVSVDTRRRTVLRPAGVRLDSGGIAKGLFCDVLAPLLAMHESFAIAAAGDIRIGGAAGLLRPVEVTSPFDAQRVLHTFELVGGAAATSGITRRSWADPRGRPTHHLLDPATGRPAFTGVVQATALAPSGVEAEALAKAALLSGPERARDWLRHGGVLVYDAGEHELVAAAEDLR